MCETGIPDKYLRILTTGKRGMDTSGVILLSNMVFPNQKKDWSSLYKRRNPLKVSTKCCQVWGGQEAGCLFCIQKMPGSTATKTLTESLECPDEKVYYYHLPRKREAQEKLYTFAKVI